MHLRIHVYDSDPQGREALSDYLRELGHETIAAVQPDHCPLYWGHPCSFENACCDAMLVAHHLPEMDALEYLSTLSRECPGAMANKAVVASLLSPEEIIAAIELGCKVLFKPILEKELASWILEVESSTPTGRKLTTVH